MLQVSRRIAAIALLALLGAVVVEAAVRVDVQVSAYFSNDCSGSPGGSTTYENGTRCRDLYQNIYFGDFLCSETGSPSGSVCGENCGTCAQTIPGNSLAFGQEYCFSGATPSFGVTCLEVTVPEAAPVEVVPAESSPQDSTVPNGGGQLPHAEVPQESHTPSVLIGEGAVSVQAYFASDCQGPSQTLPFTADIDLCQSYSAAGSTFYFRFDCYANQTTLAYGCSDEDCAACTPIPTTRSGECLNAAFSVIQSILITCPASPSAPSNTPSSPSGPSAPAAPSGDASSLQVVYASISIIAAIALLML